MSSPDTLGAQITFFFRDYLLGQRRASEHTVHSYRDSLKLLLRFTARHAGKPVAALTLEEFDAPVVLAFLEHVETERGASAATRNHRLVALRTFFRLVASNVPTAFERCQRILEIPSKRTVQRAIDYLEREEMEAILEAVDRSSVGGRRDYALLALMYNCGSRIQETLNLNARDLCLTRPAHARFFGKGRKERLCPLWPETVTTLRALLSERRIEPASAAPVFVNNRGQRLARDGAANVLAKYVAKAAERVPSVAGKRIHPHSLRHTTAMHMLRAGVDRNAIADFLGHAHSSTTERYAHADLEMKRKAIEACAPPAETNPPRWSQPDMLDFLESL